MEILNFHKYHTLSYKPKNIFAKIFIQPKVTIIYYSGNSLKKLENVGLDVLDMIVFSSIVIVKSPLMWEPVIEEKIFI